MFRSEIILPNWSSSASFWLPCLLVLLLHTGVSGNDWKDNPYGIPVTRWMSADGSKPTGYAEWKSTQPAPTPFHIESQKLLSPQSGVRERGLFCIIVNSSLYPSIQLSLDQYMIDVANDGFTASLHTTSGGYPENLRSFLQTEYAEGMVGAVLIGDLPVAWYEADCWDPLEHEEFPCDLYYMDMDGMWEDIDADDKFDEHYGNVAPEIWIGRLTASPLTYGGADEISLLQNYFVKNHLYRTEQMALNDRALVYVDDDWESWANSWSGDVGHSYSQRTLVSDPYETTAPDYASYFPQNYEAILVCAHSSPNTHWFKIPPADWTMLDYYEMVDADPVALFYNLFACSNARFVETNYMSGWYIFCQSYGLASVGSTKTGSMLEFDDFYYPFGAGKTIGNAFSDWFTSMASEGFEDWELCWFYGMTLCGDPTLARFIYSSPSILTTALNDGEYLEPYADTLEAEGGTLPYVWEMVGGMLPKDVDLDANSGIISGVPGEVGTFDVEVCVNDASSPVRSDTAQFQFTITFVCGDANGDKIINVADAVFVINYVFKDGPVPEPLETGDANCDGIVNVADAVYLINHVFKDGPPPCCP